MFLNAILRLPADPSAPSHAHDDHAHTHLFRPLDTLPAVIRTGGVEADRCLVVTDEHVAGLYGDAVCNHLARNEFEPLLIVLPPGEESKSQNRLAEICDRALAWGIERSTPLVALGGGVIGDLAGFAAATLLRGIPFFQVPTTLIAQVDSSIGGKTGINHETGKNLIGAILPPCRDPDGSGFTEIPPNA